MARFAACAREDSQSVTCQKASFATLDMFAAIDEAVRSRGLRAIYGDAHPSPAGTEITARQIAAALDEHRMVPPR